MSENILTKVTSPKWLKEAFSARARNFVNSFNFSPTIIEREVAGELHQFYIGNVTGKTWYSAKNDPCLEMVFVKRHLMKIGAVVVECGAHHGAQTILLSRWAGDTGRVIAVEPNPDNFVILKRNIEINGLTNVTVVEKAAGATCDPVYMNASSNGSVRSGGSLKVDGITVDQLALDLGIKPTFVKIDVEGYEYQVLVGCKSVLSTNPSLFVEVHTLSLPRYGKKFEDIWNSVNPDHYDIFIQADEREEPISFAQGFVPNGRVHLFFKPHVLN
jgi:FkbM family methyltransferase